MGEVIAGSFSSCCAIHVFLTSLVKCSSKFLYMFLFVCQAVIYWLEKKHNISLQALHLRVLLQIFARLDLSRLVFILTLYNGPVEREEAEIILKA